MASNLLDIAETSQKIEIDEEKLKFMCRKANVWDHFGISRSQYVSLADDEKLEMLKGFSKELSPVYFGSGKRKFCCNDCMWFDEGKRQDCIQRKVNVMACTCISEFSDDKTVPSVNSSSKRSILTALEEFDRKQKELFDRENSEREGIDNIGMQLLRHQRKN